MASSSRAMCVDFHYPGGFIRTVEKIPGPKRKRLEELVECAAVVWVVPPVAVLPRFRSEPSCRYSRGRVASGPTSFGKYQRARGAWSA